MTVVQSKSAVFGNNGHASETVTFDAPLTPGNNVLVLLSTAKTSGIGLPITAITDDSTDGNTYLFQQAFSAGNPGVGCRFHVAYVSSAGQTLTITRPGAQFLTIYAAEVLAPGTSQLWVCDTDQVSPGLTPTSGTTTPTSGPITIHETPEALLCCITWAATATVFTCTPQAPATSLFNYMPSDATTQALSIALRSSFADQDTIGFTLSAAPTLIRGGAIPLIAQNVIAVQSAGTITPTPTRRYDIRDQAQTISGIAVTTLREHSGAAAATITGGVVTGADGINNNRKLTITSGGINIPYTGAIGSVVTVMKTTGVIWGANDVANSANGAAFAQISSGNTSAQIVTSTGGSDGAVNDGATKTGMNCPIIVICTFDDATKTARLTVNGTSFTASYVGTPKTSTAMQLFGKYASGVASTGSGEFYQQFIYATPLTTVQEASLVAQLATTYFGPPITKRYLQVGFREGAETATIAESDDAKTFVNAREVSYAPPTGSVRDVSVLPGSTSYAAYTTGSFAGNTYFGVAKFTTDPRLWTFAYTVDISAQIGTKPSVAPEFVTNASGTLTHIALEEAGGSAYYLLPVTDIAAGTFGTPTTITGATGSDPFILYPGDPRNVLSPSDYVIFTSINPAWKRASAIGGPYSGGATIFTGGSFEGPDPVLMDDGTLRLFTTGGTGYGYVDFNGTTWTTLAITNGLNVSTGAAFEVGQGTVIDRNALGLWPTITVPTNALLITTGGWDINLTGLISITLESASGATLVGPTTGNIRPSGNGSYTYVLDLDAVTFPFQAQWKYGALTSEENFNSPAGGSITIDNDAIEITNS